ncbi:hypothetical protein [Burkholderia sp. SRS-W-2-2016]|uniref:hypothetical protein n=1 Tax=Burkholderia sp. SRS-W-2-2016 TaxID=1926878 RepID=UPI000B1907E7|nr:hypothetical protein [Burkholderia sp. SRS-W-2-2016]
MQGIIYRIEQPINTLQITTPLQGSYFLGAVHSSTMTSAHDGLNEPFAIRFFSGSNRSTVFCFCPVDTLSDGAKKYAWVCARKFAQQDTPVEEIGRFVWSTSNSASMINDISMFFRESATLTREAYSEVAGVEAAVDAKGMAILATWSSSDRVERALVAYMLGRAYHRMLEDAIHELAECCRDDLKVKRIEAMHSEISRFIASYYFDAPARVTTTEVGPLYETIYERLLLKSLRHELVDQLGRIAEIIRIERTAAESAFETKLQRRLTIFGSLIGILGLLQLTQTTPAQISAFVTGWKAEISNTPAVTATSPESQNSIALQQDDHPEPQSHKLKRLRHDAQIGTH